MKNGWRAGCMDALFICESCGRKSKYPCMQPISYLKNGKQRYTWVCYECVRREKNTYESHLDLQAGRT